MTGLKMTCMLCLGGITFSPNVDENQNQRANLIGSTFVIGSSPGYLYDDCNWRAGFQAFIGCDSEIKTQFLGRATQQGVDQRRDKPWSLV